MDQNIVTKFFESRKNSNCILELEEALLSADESVIQSSIDVAQDLFIQIIEKDLFVEHQNEGEAQKMYRLWLMERFNDFVDHLLEYIQYKNEEIQESAFSTLLKFVQVKIKKSVEKGQSFFPSGLVEKIVNQLASENFNQQKFIIKFKEILSHSNVKRYTLEALSNIFQGADTVSDIFLENCYSILCEVQYPKKLLLTAESQKGVPAFPMKEKAFNKLFSSTWLQFYKFKLHPLLHRKVLVSLHKKVLPYLDKPYLLTDFLTNSYTKGGVISLLALNGLFFLIEKHNLEYPDFYTKLYTLFDEDIINGKFNERFFASCDLFLSSTHMPESMVAAFIKKLSRLSLSSKTSSLLIIIPFICNILLRHPTLKCLLHRPEPKEFSSDPYDFTEPNPEKSGALESSLWEIKSLQFHVNPDVARKARMIHSLPKTETFISNILDITMYDLYEKERKRPFEESPLNIEKPSKRPEWWIL